MSLNISKSQSTENNTIIHHHQVLMMMKNRIITLNNIELSDQSGTTLLTRIRATATQNLFKNCFRVGSLFIRTDRDCHV